MIIKSERLKHAILATLADQEMIKILDSAMYQSRSVNDVIRENNIPHTTAYRKIKWLLEQGMLVVDKIEITSDGKKFTLFRSTMKSLNIKYEYNNLVVEAEENLDITKKIAERFFSLE